MIDALVLPNGVLLTDDTHALVDRRTFETLNEYSCSVPSGVYVGKVWKRKKDFYDESKGWVLGAYEVRAEAVWIV